MLDFHINGFESADFIPIPEHRETFARLEIRFGRDILTRFARYNSRSFSSEIQVPLYPLAEGIVRNWWFLFEEPGSGERDRQDNFKRRHDLYYHREGYAFPHLKIVPRGDYASVEWWQPSSKHLNGRFLEDGEEFIERYRLEESLHGFLGAVRQRLEDREITGTFFQEEYDRILNTDSEEREFCEAAARLGVDPYNVSEATTQEIFEAYEMLPREIFGEFLSATSDRGLHQDLKNTMGILEQVRESVSGMGRLQELRKKVKPSGRSGFSRPWNAGYQDARDLREAIGLNGKPLRSLEEIGERIAGSGTAFQDSIAYVSEFPKSYKAVSALTGDQSPGFAVYKNSNRQNTKFSVCRALFNYLFLPEANAGLVTHSHSDIQKRNRAFAAEFLVPAAYLEAEIGGRYVHEEEISEIAEKTDVAEAVIRRQIQNHSLAEIIEY